MLGCHLVSLCLSVSIDPYILSPPCISGVLALALVCRLGRSHGLDKMLTCRDEKDACAEDDAVPAAVELAGGHTEPPEEQQCDTEDGEDAGGPHSPCGGKERWFRLCSSQF